MSLLMVRKSAQAHAADKTEKIANDSEIVALDANGDEVIAQKNGCKLVHNTLNDGYWFYTKSGAGWGIPATNKFAAINEFNRLVDPAKDTVVGDAAEGYAQDSGNYTTNIEALLKTAYSALNKAESVVRVVLKNISDAQYKVKDGQTKAFLKDKEREWYLCKEEIYAVIKELSTIAVPPSYGIPHKEKIPPEERKIIAEFFE